MALGTIEELRSRFGQYVDNAPLARYRNRALPNVGEQTDEEAVHSHMEAEDESAFINGYRKQIAESNNE